MKKVKVEDAVGMELCHDVTAMFDGFKGAIFKRGHVIEEKDIPKLLDYGKKNIFVYEKKENEIHEEDAAIRLSKLTDVVGGHYTDVSEGKILLISDSEGMFLVDDLLLKEINSIDDITITTIPNHYHIKKGMRLVSMRIVPLVTDVSNIEKAESISKGRCLYKIVPFIRKKVGVIITGSEIYNGRIKDKFEPVCRAKLSNFPADICEIKICDDDTVMIEDAARDMIAKGCKLLIFTGGMSVDPDDVTRVAIKNIGADIISYGIPSQPGNMTLIAYKDDISIIGVPGAAVSLPTTIFDVLLPQLFTDIKLTKENLKNLANGGLCQMCDKCHYPNCTFGRY